MASWEASETPFFSLSDVRERMREKKMSVLKTAKLNASLASKIKTKIINNSSIIKVSLKHNNKALALALNAEKANTQRLTQEKIILQKEVEQCHFQNAVLRHKLSFLDNILKEFENLMAAVKMAQLSEFHTSTVSLSNDQKSSMDEDSWADDIADGQLMSNTGMPLRVLISKTCDTRQQGGNYTAVQISSLDLQRPASNEPQEVVTVVSKDNSSPQPAEMLQSQQEENGKKPTEAMEPEDFVDSCILGETLCTTKQNPNNLPAPAWENHPLSHEDNEMVKQIFDRLSQGHVTQRRKRSTLSATSTPSSGADTLPCVSSTQAAWWTITNDKSGSSKSNSQLELLKSPSYLVSPTQTTIIPDKKSLGKKIFYEQPEAKETEYGVETNLSHTRMPKFVPVNVKSKGDCKTEKTTVKKASTRKKKTNAINTNIESSPDTPQGEENTQNAKKLFQLKVAMCSSELEVSEMRQEVCLGTSDKKEKGCGMDRHSDEVQDLRRSHVVDPAQLYSLGSVKLLQEVEKEPVFEMQGVESLSERQVCAFSSHEIPSDDSSLQNSHFLRKDTSGMSRKSIRQKTKNKTKEIRQRENFEEDSLPNSEKIPEAKAEGEPKRIKTSRKMTDRKSSCSDHRNEIDVLVPCIDVQVVTNKSTKDSPSNLKPSRKTYVIDPLYLKENLGCVQTDIEVGKVSPPRPIPGTKTSKIPRGQRMTTAQSNKKTPVGLQKQEQAKGDNNMNTLRREGCPKPKGRRKRNCSRAPEMCSLARQSNGAEALTESSAELASKHTVLVRKFSCATDLLSEPDAFLKKQTADIALGENLMNLSCSLDSPVNCSVASPLSSSLTDVPASRSLSLGNRISEKSSVWPEDSLRIREKTAEEMPAEGNQIELRSQNSPSQEPETRPLQDLTNAGALPSTSSEVSGRSLRQRQEPAHYAEPNLKSKLRQGDLFTSTEFFNIFQNNTKKSTKHKRKAKIKDKEQIPEGCPSAKTSKLIMGRDMEPEAQ